VIHAQGGTPVLPNGESIAVKAPTPVKPRAHCTLWTDPEATLAKPLKQQFALHATVVAESHWWRYLLRCRDRRQRSLCGFHEEVRAGGEDPRDVTLAPVETRAEIDAVCAAPQGRLDGFVPRLCKD
jgi:hypothetical protein